MLNRISLATMLAVLMGLFATSAAMAAAPSDREPIPPPTDYWKDKGFILMAHQGGEWDFPPNTLYAYKKAMEIGADMLDMDAYVTADKQIVLTHDLKASDNSDAPTGDGYDINDLTLEQLKEYDFAYKWSPRGSSEDPFRGVATGDVPPPAGFTANDFKIPSLEEVLVAFPDTPINIELKQVSGVSIDDTVTEMDNLLEANPGHEETMIINSFGQEMLDAMAAKRPEHLAFGGSLASSIGYIQGGAITPTPVAIEPPDFYNLPPWVRTVPILKPWADHDGYKIFVWGSDHDPEQDTAPFYEKLIAEGADSYNTPSPTTLAEYLCENGVADPDGNPRCAEQICPEGQIGIAPNDCEYPPCPEGQVGTAPDCGPPLPAECPAGQVGTPPNCSVVVTDPAVKVSRLALSPKKGKVKADKKTKLTLKVTSTSGLGGGNVKISLKSSNRQVKLPKSVTVRLRSGATVKKTITVRAGRKAKGQAKVTATAQGKRATNVLKVVKAKKKRR